MVSHPLNNQCWSGNTRPKAMFRAMEYMQSQSQKYNGWIDLQIAPQIKLVSLYE